MNEEPIISKQEMASLLGRSLTAIENTNYDLYLKIAIIRLEDLLCITFPSSKPVDLMLLLARCFGVISTENTLSTDGGTVESKKVEDFQVTYDTSDQSSPMVKFVRLNSGLIAKYSECQGKIRSGKLYGDCLYPI